MFMSSLESEKEAAKDREKRRSNQIKMLSAALETAKADQEASDRRMTNIWQDTKFRISSNTVGPQPFFLCFSSPGSPKS